MLATQAGAGYKSTVRSGCKAPMNATRNILLAATLFVASAALPLRADEAKENVMSAVSGTTISGYVSTSAIWKFGTGVSEVQSPLLPLSTVNSDTIGTGLFYIPANYDSGAVSVVFGIAVSTQDVGWSEGHLFDGNTEWTFNLGTGTFQNGATYYVGSTDMTTAQVQSMLAGNAEFEISSDTPAAVLQGNLVAVPEPSTVALMVSGVAAALLARRKGRCPRNHELEESII